MKIDFLTHRLQESDADLAITCHYQIEDPLPSIIEERNWSFCVGLHPWYLPESWQEAEVKLKEWIKHPLFLGLGECGLDRVKGAPWDKQVEFFRRQLQFAKEHHLNFIVIHAVRSIPDCIGLIQKSGFRGKVVFHDYHANAEQTYQLLKKDQFYFSLGSALDGLGKFTDEFSQLKKNIFIKRAFVETDERAISINDRYRQLSKLLELSSEEIENQIQQNFYNLTH